MANAACDHEYNEWQYTEDDQCEKDLCHEFIDNVENGDGGYYISNLTSDDFEHAHDIINEKFN